MAKLIKEKTASGRLHIESPLMGESLVSKESLKQNEAVDYFYKPSSNLLLPSFRRRPRAQPTPPVTAATV